MKRMVLATVLVSLLLVLGGCGDDHGSPPLFRTQILSDAAVDGDIARDQGGALTVTQGMSPTVQSVFAGVDAGTGVEYRAFLDFPLGGQGGIPPNALIDSAVLDIFIDSIAPQRSIPLRIELVNFQPPTLLGTDFDRASLPPLAVTTIVPPISPTDVGKHVIVDVTPLMAEAQRLQLPDFQVRITQDPGGLPGNIEIDDTTGGDRATFAPLLDVTYF